MKNNYNGESPCIPFIWIMLENLDRKGLLIRKYRTTCTTPISQTKTK